MKGRELPILALVLAIAFALSPLLSDSFGGFKQSDFPVQAPWYAQPAGWAFSLWGVIYLGLLIATGMGVWKGTEQWSQVSKPLCVSLLVVTPWIEIAGNNPLIATVMMFPIWLFAVWALMRANGELWQRIPLGLYAGWLTAAMCVAFSVSLTGHGILEPLVAALACLSLAIVLAIMVLRRLPERDWAYRAAAIWALVGVIVANLEPMNTPVVVLCAVAIPVLIWVPPAVPYHRVGR